MTKQIISEIEQTLRQEYPSGFGAVFIGSVQEDNLSFEVLKKEIQSLNITPPESFYTFYEWLCSVEFPFEDVYEQTELNFDEENFILSLDEIISSTRSWLEIQKKQPHREWKSGFLAIASWNSCYQLVIDTKGEVASEGNMLVWDFKGGKYYKVIYQSFDLYLKTKLELLKAKLYFPPSPSDEEAYEDFMYGETRDKINKIIADLNGEPQVISF